MSFFPIFSLSRKTPQAVFSSFSAIIFFVGKYGVGKFALYFLLFLFLSCAKVPVSGRRQVNMLPETTMMSMSLTSYRSFLSKNSVVDDGDERTQNVKKVGAKISDAVRRFMIKEKLQKRIAGYNWEFNLVDDKIVNAWCMPGGKVVVYTGLLPVSIDETGLAVVMGHEIAHAIARHGNERMSQQLMVALGGIGLAVAMQEKQQQTQDIFNLSYGAASTLGVLKYSRVHESEADKMGLVFIAMAGYNPEEAVGFWERMAKNVGGKMPEILSTHPSDETRIKNIKAFLPKAKTYYIFAKN